MLTDHCVEPADSKQPQYLVIFFHGYGANGSQMAEHVGKLLGPLLPEAKIRCPDGPIDIHTCEDGTVLKSWFELRDLTDGERAPDMDEVGRRATAAAREMNDYIDKVVAEDGISEQRVIIAGFSQGGTMAFYAGLLRDTAVGGVYALSGGALDRLQNPKSFPPVGLVAGGNEQQDYSGAPHAEKVFAALDKAGFQTGCFIIPGQGHDISWKSMELLSVFARTVTAPAFESKVSKIQSDKAKNPGPGP